MTPPLQAAFFCGNESEVPWLRYMRKKYEHSAYYYAYHYGWTYSEARTYAGKYLDMHTYRPRKKFRRGGGRLKC